MAAMWWKLPLKEKPVNDCLWLMLLKNNFLVVIENILEPVTGFIVLYTGRHVVIKLTAEISILSCKQYLSRVSIRIQIK
jgi:hypothetical protein